MAKKEIELLSANSIIDEEKEIISWSPQIDKGLSGGIMAGSTVVVGGPPKLGKTTSILHFCKNAQKVGYTICYGDVESRVRKRDLLGIPGLDLSPEKFTMIRSTKDRILEGEEYMEKLEQVLKSNDRVVGVIDSLSALCCKDLIEGDIKERYRDSSPLLISRFCKRVCNYIGVTDNIFIGVTHIIANQGQGHKTWMEASGNKIRYACDFKLRGTHADTWTVGSGTNAEQVGQDIHWKCECSGLGKPNRDCTSKLRYNEGIDEHAELIELAKEIGVVRLSGAWYYFEEEKWQGLEKFVIELKQNQSLYDTIRLKTRKMLGWK